MIFDPFVGLLLQVHPYIHRCGSSSSVDAMLGRDSPGTNSNHQPLFEGAATALKSHRNPTAMVLSLWISKVDWFQHLYFRWEVWNCICRKSRSSDRPTGYIWVWFSSASGLWLKTQGRNRTPSNSRSSIYHCLNFRFAVMSYALCLDYQEFGEPPIHVGRRLLRSLLLSCSPVVSFQFQFALKCVPLPPASLDFLW